MWGWAGQFVATVIAVVLVHPVSPIAPVATFGPYVVSGRAFATILDRESLGEISRPLQRRTPQAYARLASYRYVAPANRTAVIVGINHAQGTPPLPGSVNDAKHLYSALIGYGFTGDNITLLLEERATRPAILSALRSMAERSSPTGIAVFAIATHTRRSGGTNYLATAEGKRISARELASQLSAVRARTWIALPTCYAGGYALPGIVGPNRIATFASSADRQSYQVGEAGSFLFIHMVRRAMLEGRAPYSVESAFAFARDEIARDHPEQVPLISDGVPEDLILGPSNTALSTRWDPPPREAERDEGFDYTYDASESYGPEPSPTPEPRRRGPATVCRPARFNCAP